MNQITAGHGTVVDGPCSIQSINVHPVKSVAAAAAAVPIPPLPTSLLPAVGTSSELTQQQLQVLGAWYSMYCPDKEAQQVAALEQYFDSKASFEDNFIKILGRQQLSTLFYALQLATKSIRLELEKIEVIQGSSSSSSGSGSGTYQIRITGRHYFYLPQLIRGPVMSLFLPPALEAWATDTLTVREADSCITHWQQRVHNIPTAPWLLRASLGYTGVTLLMHALGW